MTEKDLATRLNESKDALRTAEAKAEKCEAQAKAAWDRVRQVKRMLKDLKKSVKKAGKAARRTAKEAKEQVKASRKALKDTRKKAAKLEGSLDPRPAKGNDKKLAKQPLGKSSAKNRPAQSTSGAPNPTTKVSGMPKVQSTPN